MEFDNLFELEEAKKQNILLSGANSSGKTRLSCGIASMLKTFGTVQVYDVSGIWKNLSDLPHYSKANKVNNKAAIQRFERNQSGIYDLSYLTLTESKQFVEDEARRLWEERAILPQQYITPLWLIYEEAEAYLRYARNCENLHRLIHIGRNQNIRVILITTDLALIDPSIIRLCSIRFHGYLNIEENSKRKFKSYYGSDWTRIAYEGLETGDFIRLQNRKLDVVSVPCFRTEHKPQPINQQAQPKKKGILNKIWEIMTIPAQSVNT